MALSSGYTYFAVCLALQSIKERGIIDMRVRAKVALYSIVLRRCELTFDIGELTSYVGELVGWRTDSLAN